MKNKSSETAKQILEYVGGKGNLIRFTHCATRLRFNVSDESKVQYDKLNALEAVFSTVNAHGQIQVIVGGRVVELYDAISQLLPDISAGEVPDDDVQESKATGKSKNPLTILVETVSQIFAPLLPGMVGCGMVRSFLLIFVRWGLIANTSDTYQLFDMLGNVVFYFMPFLLAVSAAERFKTNRYLSMGIAGILMSPLILNSAAAGETLSLFGLIIQPRNYSSTIVPIILSILVMSYLYKWINRILPPFIRSILTPVLTLGIMLPLSLLLCGPVGYIIGEGIAQVIQVVYNTGGIFAAFLLGLFRSPLTIMGLHYSIGPIQIQEIAQTGYSVLFPTALCANLSQCAATLAVAFLTRKKGERVEALSAAFSASCGITEPAMFGFSLKYKTPFVSSCVAAACGSAYISFFQARCYAQGLPGLLTLGNFETTPGFQLYIGLLLSVCISFGLTCLLGINGKSDKWISRLIPQKKKS